MIHLSDNPKRARRGRAAILIGLLAVACAPEAEPEREATVPAETPAAEAAVKPLPTGDLEQWVADVAVAADSVVALSRTDLKAAQQRTMMLYLDRQEIIEQQYGPGGQLNAPAAVGDAVMEAERRFHRLLAVVNSPDTATVSVQIGAVADSLKVQHQEVVRLVKESGLPLDPRKADAS